ncbi:MAG TPA: chromosomal replication initiator protein DnaA [Casimicrobiaceae bacterium]
MQSVVPPGAWAACLAVFERELSPQQFSTWIKPLRCVTRSGSLCLTAPNRFVLQWVRERFGGRIETLARESAGGEVSVEYAVAVHAVAGEAATPATAAEHSSTGPAAAEPPSTVPAHAEPPAAAPPPVAAPGIAVAGSFERDQRRTLRGPATPGGAGAAPGAAGGLATPRRPEPGGLNPAFTFESFVTGKANQLARAAGLQVAEHPTSYNPLFVYGGVGLGKTHLIQAIGQRILAENPAAKIRYIHAETYVSDVVRAYQHKAFDDFKRHYRSLDLLLIDDIQFIGNKSRTQEEFFYLFNTLIEAHRQVVITCDTFPKEIAGVEERLISRFGWGLTVALEPPELEMRVAIFLSKAASVGVRLDEQVAFFVAKHIRSNVRELEGALKRILAYADFHRQEITLPVVKEALRDLLAVHNRQVSIENIQKTVAEYYKLRVSDMHSKKRSRAVARPRQVAMALAKELTQLSLPEIGSNFGGRDHTTVLHACRQVAKLRETLPDLNHDVNVLLQVLRS